MADRTRLSGTQAGGRVGTFRRTRVARLPPSRHPLHCGLRIPNLRAREDSPLSKSCHQGVPAICLTPRLPVQRIRHCGLNATFRTRLQQCDGDWWSLSPRCYRVAHVARLGTGVEICDTVRLPDRCECLLPVGLCRDRHATLLIRGFWDRRILFCTREVPFDPDFVDFTVPDVFIVGYGID